MPASVRQYLKEISAVGAEATEHSYRSPLEIFLKTLAGDAAKTRKTGKLTVLHEPSRKKYIGAPDFLILNNGGAAVGCVECKNPGDNLDALAGGKQVKKYAALSPNIILTDYYRFILLREGKIADDIKLTKKSGAKELQAAEELLHAFFAAEAQSIGDAKELAAALALRCAPLRDALVEILPDDKSKLSGLFKSFQQTIYRELDGAQFADALAQTLVYGLLMAKLKASDGEKLDLYNAEKHIPQNFALIGEIVGFLKELRRAEYQSVQYLTESVLAAVNAMDERAVADSMAYKKNTGGEDPYLNFYETFLAAYDAEMKKSRGVYYTPPSVARFIVRAADDILRRDFGLAKGLGDPKVTALDFAAGTGTFMLEMFRQIFGEASPAQRRALAREHLLKNFYGFEFLIAPYVIAHLKLSRFLEDNGAALQNGERVHVYLTNTLEQVSKQTAMDFMPALVEETATAQQIKNRDILVITGNPPYSAVSQNNGEWIKTLLRAYFQADGKPLGERNPRWLQDDYVKFIRFAQWKMEQINEGVVAIITNHAFLDNPTFRGMRESLLKTFNRLYFLDLHGNS
ncbi:MAG: N-6 DNA methylase, partial [Gammaproteobacteria bacterium]